MILYRSRYLVSMDRPPIENGGMLVSAGRIAAAGDFDDLRSHHTGEIVDLGEKVLLPGLINAHCHLEYTVMRNTILTATSFEKWIQRINAAKRHFSNDDYLRGIAEGARLLAKTGTTTIFNIESYPELLNQLPHLPQRIWWFYEIMDIRLRTHDDESMRGALSVFGSRHLLGGLSPHAPYTASPELYRLALQAANAAGLPLTTHVAESFEEMRCYRDGSGPLFDFLKSLGKNMDQCGNTTPFRALVENGCIDPRTILVHLNELDAADFSLIPQFTAGQALQVVHCPKSHAFFHHSPFQYQKLRDLGANISLGTDSLASNSKLDMFAEMRAFAQSHPHVSPSEILQMATVNPARSLGIEKTLGCLRAGARADAIALPVADSVKNPRDIFEFILHYKGAVDWMLIDGAKIPL